MQDVDYIGKRFGSLVAVENAEHYKVRFVCDCGGERVSRFSDVAKVVSRGGSPSCCPGCSLRSRPSKTHGMAKTRQYKVWASMVQRCTSPGNPAWEYYGGRGIEVCERWLDFDKFWEDMASGYIPGLTIERVDNSRGYCKGNCLWVTRKVQSNNRRSNHVIDTPLGPMTVSQAAEVANINESSMRDRLRAKWPVARILLKKYSTLPTADRATAL
jgi:hypothetical protein